MKNMLFQKTGMKEKSVQYIFEFPNNYGASVIKAPGTFGYKYDLWEVLHILDKIILLKE